MNMFNFVRAQKANISSMENTSEFLAHIHALKFFPPRLDGYVRRQAPERDLILEIFGCYWVPY